MIPLQHCFGVFRRCSPSSKHIRASFTVEILHCCLHQPARCVSTGSATRKFMEWEDNLIQTSLKSHVSLDEIAHKLGRQKAAIRYRTRLLWPELIPLLGSPRQISLLTVEDDALILRLRQQGRSFKSIALELQRHPSTVRKHFYLRCKINGLDDQQIHDLVSCRLRAGHTMQHVANELNCPPQMLWYRYRRLERPVYQRWTSSEDELVQRRLQEGVSMVQISKEIGRTVGSLNTRHSPKRKRPFAPEEVQKMRSQLADGVSMAQVGRNFGRHQSVIFKCLRRLDHPQSSTPPGLRPRQTWLRSETDELVRLYKNQTPLDEIAQRIGRSVGSVHGKISRLGYTDAIATPGRSRRKPFTADEDELIISMRDRDKATFVEIASKLQTGRPVRHVGRRYHFLALSRSARS